MALRLLQYYQYVCWNMHEYVWSKITGPRSGTTTIRSENSVIVRTFERWGLENQTLLETITDPTIAIV
jgi:hypothetical protein